MLQAEGVEVVQASSHTQGCNVRQAFTAIDVEMHQAAGCRTFAECPHSHVCDALTVSQDQGLHMRGRIKFIPLLCLTSCTKLLRLIVISKSASREIDQSVHGNRSTHAERASKATGAYILHTYIFMTRK